MKILKRITFAGLALVSTLTVNAQSLPQPSPMATFTQVVGVTEVSMEYSRPGVKERVIWGDLVKYDEVWRAGANASTKISFSTTVQIAGVDIKEGTYALFIVPSESNDWEIIISNYTSGWGTTGYTKESDVVRFKAPVKNVALTENLLFMMDEITDESGLVIMRWEKKEIAFRINVNTDKYGNKIVEELIQEADNAFRKYNDAAKWYLGTGNDKLKALEMAKKSCELSKKFWNLTVLSEAYAANGDYKMAIKTAKEALEMSKAANYAPYMERNQDNIENWSVKK